ncbi:MAG: hypothetical protein ACREPU_13510 [Rhodanobacteraceae bacterium]
MPKPGFLQELKRHHVFRVAAAYAVVGWLIIQVVAIVFPLLQFPEWVARLIVVIVLAGFPVALVVAWAFQAPRDDAHTSQSTRRRSLRMGVALGAAGLLVAVIVGGLWWYLVPVAHKHHHIGSRVAVQSNGSLEAPPTRTTTSKSLPAAPVNQKSIAVLPLVNIGGNPDERYLGEGISEELLNALSRIAGLEVIGRTSSFRFRNSDLGAKEIGRTLGVRNLLSGTVQRSGNELRIDIELDDTVTGVELWSQQYDQKMGNLFALEDKISDAVVSALQVKLGDIDARNLVFAGTANPQAHDLYLQATRLSWHTDEASLEQALVLFNQAVAEDPNYAAAWAGMARAYVYLADVYRAPLDVLPAMRGAAGKAVALNPKLAEGHLQLGYIAMSYEWDFPTAKKELELAVKLRPSLAEAHAILGLYLLRVGKDPSAARAELQTARKLDPLNPWYPRWQMFAAIAQRDEPDAMQLAQRVEKLDPNFAYNGDAVALVDSAFGHWQACVNHYKSGRATVSRSSPQLAICQAHVGDEAPARAVAAALEADAKRHYVDRAYIAAIYAALGDKDLAMAELDRAYRDHSVHMVSLWLDSWFRPLHGDPRFQALVARIRSGTQPAAPATSSDSGR